MPLTANLAADSPLDVRLPYKVLPNVTETSSRIELDVNIKAMYDQAHMGVKLEVMIPTPPNTAKVTLRSEKGKIK